MGEMNSEGKEKWLECCGGEKRVKDGILTFFFVSPFFCSVKVTLLPKQYGVITVQKGEKYQETKSI